MSFATVFKPGRAFIERFRFGTKFAIVGLVLLLPFIILFHANWQRINHDIAVAEKERLGLQSIETAMHFMQQAQLHRRYSRALLQGEAPAASQLASTRTRADEMLQAWQVEDERSGAVLGTSSAFAEVRSQWDNVKAKAAAVNIGESMNLHGRLVDAVNVYIAQVGVNAGLSRDPDADAYFLQDAAIVRLPAAAESLRLLRASVIKAARQKQLLPEERIAMQLALQDAERTLAAFHTDLNRAGQATPSVQVALQGAITDFRERQTRFLQMVRNDVLEAKRIQLDEGKAESFGSDTVSAIYKIFDGAMQQLDVLLQARIAKLQKSLRLDVMVSASVLLLALYLFASLRNSVLDQIRHMRRAAHYLADGQFSHPIVASSRDEIGDFAQALDKVRLELGARMENERQQAEAIQRVKMALDNAGTPFRIADGKGTVVYANAKMFDVLRSIEPELKRRNPDFSLEGFIGSSIGTLMSNPTEYLTRLEALRELAVTEMEIDGRTFNVTTAPVFGANGERIGTVGEWIDRTEQVAVEREVAAIVNAAAAGDFSKRVALGDKQGFFLSLGQGINQVLETSERGLHEVGQVLQALARGDLSQQLNGNYQGLFAQLQQDVNATVTNLKVLVSQIRDVSEAINTAAQEIASGNADLSSRTEEQASSLEETASSMEELSATVRQNADSARQANALADSSNVLATRGGEMVQRVVNTMGDIQTSAKRIADIVGVIDAIAFQTNILALNAAVEAARAGEQGRGFAVVASEVRSLAQRSATAAKEIKELIAESAGKVEHGVTLVEQTGATMSDVVSSFARVAQLVTDISNASREQASGIDQVTRAVGQMDEVTQQNAALVEEAAAAAESLEEQAHGLVEVMARFKLDDSDTPAVSRGTADLRDATPRRLGRQPVGRLGVSKGGRPVSSPHPNDLDEEWQEF